MLGQPKPFEFWTNIVCSINKSYYLKNGLNLIRTFYTDFFLRGIFFIPNTFSAYIFYVFKNNNYLVNLLRVIFDNMFLIQTRKLEYFNPKWQIAWYFNSKWQIRASWSVKSNQFWHMACPFLFIYFIQSKSTKFDEIGNLELLKTHLHHLKYII